MADESKMVVVLTDDTYEAMETVTMVAATSAEIDAIDNGDLHFVDLDERRFLDLEKLWNWAKEQPGFDFALLGVDLDNAE